MSDKDGGPAFPRIDGLEPDHRDTRTHVVRTSGMSLRDWFAGQAMAGLLVAPGQAGDEARHSEAKCAEWAYSQADAMLARKEGED